MSQILSPLYGDYLNDTYVAKAAAQRPGFLVAPAWSQAASGADVAVTLGTDPDLGFWAWKTRWLFGQGAFTFAEDAPVVVTSLDATANPYQLLVGRWEWTTGSLDVNGHPNGDYEAGMHPVYQFEAAMAGDMVDDLIHTSLTQPDINGRYGVVLGVLNHGVFSVPAAAMLDPAKQAIQHLPIAISIRAMAQAASGTLARIVLAGATIAQTGDAPVANGSSDFVIQRAGFYLITASTFTHVSTGSFTNTVLFLNGTEIDRTVYIGASAPDSVMTCGLNLVAGDVLSFQYTSNYTTDYRVLISRA